MRSILSVKTLLCAIAILLLNRGQAQIIGINTTGAPANSSSMLDVSATEKGILIQRMPLTSITDMNVV